MYKNERCIIIDESGNLGTKGRYFVIACIDTFNVKSIHNIMKKKIKLYGNNTLEIKASHSTPMIKEDVLKSLLNRDYTISYIVADLHNIYDYLKNDKNMLYNFLLKVLLTKIISVNDSKTKINLLLDSHSVKVRSGNSFSDYIKLIFNYDNNYNINFNIQYINSNSYDGFIIQAIDFIANAIYVKYEYNNSKYYSILKDKLNIIQKFPYKSFNN